MFSKINSAGIHGIEGYLVSVEVDVSNGLPCFSMVGFLSGEVREAQERVRTALRNSGILFPPKKVTINLSPADVKKEGTAFDLAISVAVMCAYGVFESNDLIKEAFIGELGLDGRIKAVCGVLPRVEALQKAGITRCFLPRGNVLEGTAVKEIEIVGVSQVSELIELLKEPGQIIGSRYNPKIFQCENKKASLNDFSDMNGQLLLKRAAEVAVAGMHNILLIGAAGTGKTMLAKRMPSIMPSISHEESMAVSKIYSICGLLPQSIPIIRHRPFRSPHHSITSQALIGGGRSPRPGEISLACHGILFLDELPEFRGTLDLLRQPLEEKRIVVSRMNGSYEFPANCMVVAAMNPCRCGYYPDRTRCSCTEAQVKNYLGRISRPLLERFDLFVESASVSYEELTKAKQNETSTTIRLRVEKARKMQSRRFKDKGIYFNSEMSGVDIGEFCSMKSSDKEFMRHVYEVLGLSARTYNKVLKVARTVADLDEAAQIQRDHLSEAVSYCSLRERYWGR